MMTEEQFLQIQIVWKLMRTKRGTWRIDLSLRNTLRMLSSRLKRVFGLLGSSLKGRFLWYQRWKLRISGETKKKYEIIKIYIEQRTWTWVQVCRIQIWEWTENQILVQKENFMMFVKFKNLKMGKNLWLKK